MPWCREPIMAAETLRNRPVGAGAVLMLAFAWAASTQSARADTVTMPPLFQGSTLVYGSQSDVYSLNAPGPGTLNIHIDDTVWPEPLQGLSVSVMSPDSLLGQLFASSDPSAAN